MKSRRIGKVFFYRWSEINPPHSFLMLGSRREDISEEGGGGGVKKEGGEEEGGREHVCEGVRDTKNLLA